MLFMDALHFGYSGRLALYTLAMAAVLLAPAALQAALLLWPNLLSAREIEAAMPCVLAATIVAFPALVAAMLKPDQRGLPP